MKTSSRTQLLSFALTLAASAPIALAADVSVLSGLSQSLLFKGGNLEVNYRTENWVFDYSHGWDLEISRLDAALTKSEKQQNLKVQLPYSTGGGIGYRVTRDVHVALELKQHLYRITHPTDGRFDYTTRTLGVGLYYNWQPFKNSGFTIMPAIRYWPTVYTSRDKIQFSTGEVHRAHTSSSISPNIKIGWTF